MASQPFCPVCYGDSLTFENGVLVCDTCGTQTQTFQEGAEFQAGIDDARGKRRAAGSSTAGQQSQATLLAREEEMAAQQLQDAALAYVRCLQQLLQAQAEVLTTRFGISSQVSTVLRQLWLSHLPSTGMLEPTPHQPPAAALSAATGQPGAAAGVVGAATHGVGAAADGADGSTPDALEQQQQLQQRSTVLVMPKNMKQLFWKLLHPQVTLQLCFLACTLLREAVTFYDIICWALDGLLPYLDLPDIASGCMPESELSVLPVRCIQPDVSLTPSAFYNSSCQLADQLGLQLPHIAGEALLLREVQELGLPQVALDLCLQLFFMYLIRSPRLRVTSLTKSAPGTPYVWLSAVVVVAIKLLYGLGSAAGSVPLVPKAPAPPNGWQAWSQGVIQALPGITSMPLSEEEALALSPEGRQQYMQFCRRHVFSGQPTVPTFDDIQRLLLGWYESSVLPTPMTHPPCTAASGEQQPQQQLQPPVPSPDQAQSLLQPAPGLDSYSLATSVAGAGAYRLEPQLASVVLAVAAYSRCGPATLLECVKALEKQMLGVEGGVKILQEIASTKGSGSHQHPSS